MRISDWSSDVCSSDLKGYLLERGAFDRELWERFGAQGWTAICYPEAFGGLDLGLLELGLVAEACGGAVTGVAALTSSFAMGQSLLRFGSAEQKGDWLPGSEEHTAELTSLMGIS